MDILLRYVTLLLVRVYEFTCIYANSGSMSSYSYQISPLSLRVYVAACVGCGLWVGGCVDTRIEGPTLRYVVCIKYM
jgi:hypothetical protein